MKLIVKVAIGLLIAFVVFAGAGLLFSARPTPVLGVDGDSLAHSIENSAPCTEGDGIWNCWRNSNVGYRVEVGWDGCWDATLYKGAQASSPPVPRNRSGCIDIWDHLELEDTFN